ncbi:hypothetical protein R5R35_002552 [Gryllus longicercus]|uniref:Protein PET117 homolog, mitochondrial n=1 Tax=Gryllus longicercus TaxID=2509291 RepID=A0AAN9Z929_9ORTH|nr:Uncharacterized protein GBIM_13586 [Gryllus bimaculatus]
MSLASKAALGVSLLVSIGIVGYVHYRQQIDREKMHEGVIRDVYRQQQKKTQNLYFLQKQADLTEQLRKEKT